MSGFLAAFALSAASFGWGLLALAALRPDPRPAAAWGWPLGVGLLGWFGCWLGAAGLLAPGPILALLAPGWAGLALARPRRAGGPLRPPSLSPMLIALAALLALVAAATLAQGLCPPGDADSLAYHFALARRMAESGHLVFEPRAIDGAVPQLLQTTYALAYALGGERAMTLWCGISGWLAVPLLHHLVARRAGPAWGLAAVLLWLTTPTVLYAGGTGQVEPRTAAFALVAIAAVAEGRGWRWAVLGGLAAGFYAGSKYPGLLLAAAALAVLLARGRDLRAGLAFALAAALAGGQWYVWNWLNIGDPVFPMLARWLPVPPELWNQAQAAFMAGSFGVAEVALPRTPAALLAYPFLATFAPADAFDAGRAGLGLFPVLALPFALAAAWAGRRRLAASPLTTMAAVVALTAVLWFFLGPSQRVRHLLPLLPALLAVLTVALARLGPAGSALKWPAGAAVALCLGLGGAGLAVADLKYVRHLAGGESRADFLDRNVGGAAMAAEINRVLPADSRLFNTERQLNYLIERPLFYGNAIFQTVVEIRPGEIDPLRFWTQLRRGGFTHVLFRRGQDPADWPTDGVVGMTRLLVDLGCAEAELVRPFSILNSRTLPGLGGGRGELRLYRLTPATCSLSLPVAEPR
ncbi:hypothetical protein [Phaeospirillum tilakii]|uniref:Glycosyltransferase RgtA/B/C/D-like domain-containing protein n=1 Tax=Phaeospirillum tilakii TaxID=741673 RepID=A0ABW5CF88_9PROT